MWQSQRRFRSPFVSTWVTSSQTTLGICSQGSEARILSQVELRNKPRVASSDCTTLTLSPSTSLGMCDTLKCPRYHTMTSKCEEWQCVLLCQNYYWRLPMMRGKSLSGLVPHRYSGRMGSDSRWGRLHLHFWTTRTLNASYPGVGLFIIVGPSRSHPSNIPIESLIQVGLSLSMATCWTLRSRSRVPLLLAIQ